MKKLLVLIMIFASVLHTGIQSYAYQDNESSLNASTSNFEIDAASAILMEAETGKILYAQNEDKAAPPASVTKVMTLLLVAEAINDGKITSSDSVSISDHAASMGGSQVFLEEGEIFSVEELLKCTVIASANDAAVALAEHVSGSESAFVEEMNKRAVELGMKNTKFENVTGLDDTTTEHLTSAKDIGIMSCELIKHNIITKYSSLWQDSIRGGEFTLTNTNRLVRYYDGCNGLKTGSTSKAGYCISATAKRNGMQLVAVIMGAKTRDIRNAEARKLLDHGFANYTIYKKGEEPIETVPVSYGKKENTVLYSREFSTVVLKSDVKNIEVIYDIPKKIAAPISENQSVGKISYKLNGEFIGSCDIIVKEKIDKISYFDILFDIIFKIFK